MVGDGDFVLMFVLDTHFAPTSIHVRCCCTATTTAAFLVFIPSVFIEPSKVVHLFKNCVCESRSRASFHSLERFRR